MIARIAAGFVLGFFAVGVLAAACGAPAVVDCRIRAALAVPLDDPDSITVGDTRRLAQRLKACDAGDAGL